MGVGLQAKSWRFISVFADPLGGAAPALTVLDRIASDRHVETLLNVPNWLSFTVPSDSPLINTPWPTEADDPYVSEGNRLIYAFRQESDESPYYVCRAAGTVMQIEDTAEQDNARTLVTAFDPWKMAYLRPAQASDGDLPTEMGTWDGVYAAGTPVYVVILTQLLYTILNNGFIRIDAGDGSRVGEGVQYQDWGGTEFYEGTIEVTDDLLNEYNVGAGQSVGDVWSYFTSTSYCDIILTPIYDPVNRPGYTHEMNIYTQAGTFRENAIFGWGRPPQSLIQLSRMKDGTQRANQVKIGAGQGSSNWPSPNTEIFSTSIDKYGEYWAQQVLPGIRQADVAEQLADFQGFLRQNGRTTVQFSPTPERSPSPFTEYFIGDTVQVSAGGVNSAYRPFRQDIDANVMRIYGFPIDISDDALEEVRGMILLSPTS